MLVADLVIKPERVMQGIGEALQSLDELRAVHSRAVLVIAHGMCGPAPAPEGKHMGVPDILCLERCFSKDNKLFASGLGGIMECCPPGIDRPEFAAPPDRKSVV